MCLGGIPDPCAHEDAVEPVSLIKSADQEALVQQAYVLGWHEDFVSNPYVAALRELVDEDVGVCVLLDGRWYYDDKNADVADKLNGSGIDARFADREVHTKGVVVDGESVFFLI